MSYYYRTSRPRRARFTVYREGFSEPIVCLAWTAEGVRQHYTLAGYNVTRVVKGDYRKQEQAAALKAAGGFTIDQAAIRDACDLLGIKLPVKVRTHSRVGNVTGNYRFRNGYHDIMLKSYRTAAEASATLWHELCHAMQAERAGDEAAWGAVLSEQGRYPYRLRPIEREARKMAEDMGDILLARPICHD